MTGTRLKKDMEERIRHLETRVKALEGAKNYYRAFFEHSLYGAVILDPETLRPIEFNDQVCRQLGYTREEFARLHLLDIDTSEKVEEMRGRIQKITLDGFDTFETLHRTKQGEIRNIHVSAQVINVEERQVYHCIWWDITEKKLSEKAIRESERHYRLLTENVTDTIWMMSLDGTFLYHSPSVEKLRGYTPSEANKITLEETMTPESMSFIRGIFQNENNKPMEKRWADRTIELEMYRKDGTTIWTEVSVRAVKDENGIIVGLQGSTRNIDERKQSEMSLLQAEKELKESEEKYRLLVENQSDMVVKVDTDGRFLFVSPTYCRTFGKREEELLGRQFMPLVHEDDRAPTAKAMEALYVPPHTAYVEQRAMTKDGWRWLAWVDTAILDKEGNVLEIIGVGRDITKRKRVEDAVRQSENKFRSLFNLSPQAIAVTDLKTGRLVDVNHKLCEVTHYSKDEIVGRATTEVGFYSNKDRIRFVEELEKSGQVNGLEMDFVTKEGSVLKTLMFARLFDVSGESLVITIFHDITAQKRLERSLQRAQKMESIGTLSGGIAHDFNNILFPIVGMSEMLMEDFPPDSETYSSAKEIFTAAKRGSDLVKQILAFSRQSDHRLIPVQIQRILKEVINLSRSTIPTYIDIGFNIQKECGMVMADPTQLHQVAMNLVTNAYHALEATGGKISVTLKETQLSREELSDPELKHGKYAEITVSDTGCGFDPSLKDKIFEPYFTTKETGKGTGLGLAVVYGIVKGHHGDIKISSKIGMGTTVKVFLPMMESSYDHLPNEIPQKIETGTERILLIDDEVSIAKVGKQMLERLGYKVTMCLNSPEALKVFSAEPDAFDLVVSDMAMPNMTGDRLARRLIEIRPDIPIIICTGFSEMLDEEIAATIGIKGFLLKPVVKAEIAKMIREVLARP